MKPLFPRLLPLGGLCVLLLTACAREEAVSYKALGKEWDARHCVGYGEAGEDRTVIYSPTPDGKFALEICAQNRFGGKRPGNDYTGPVVLRVLERSTQKVLAQETWAMLRAGRYSLQASLTTPGTDIPTVEFSDGTRRFAWTASELQLAAATPLRVLNYDSCLRTSYNSLQDANSGYLFEHCEGIARLSAYPSGEEVRLERLGTADVGNVAWDADTKTVSFTAGAAPVRWSWEP